MSRDLVKVVPLTGGKRISEMTDAERWDYVNKLVDGGIFSGVPGLSSDESDAPDEKRPGTPTEHPNAELRSQSGHTPE